MIKRKEIAEDLLKKEKLEEFKEITKVITKKLDKIIKKFKKISLVTHNNPDPDAVSSCLAIQRYLYKQEIKQVEIFANLDSISRETKALINDIGIKINPLKNLKKNEEEAVILIDIASVNQSNLKIKKIKPDLVIDHHSTELPFSSTATIVTLLMDIFEIEIKNDLATALYIGIETDTQGFTSDKFTEFDELAFRLLAPLIDTNLRKKIIKCGYSDTYRRMHVKAWEKYFNREESIVISGVGYIEDKQRTNLAKIANSLHEMEGVEKVTVIAIVEKEIEDQEKNTLMQEKYIVPATRSSTGTENAGELNKKVFGEKVAGGDPNKASGAIKLDPIMTRLIEQAKKDKNEEILEAVFLGILKLYKEKILEKQTE